MTLRVVGAGLGRTGTHSLQLALQQLLGGRCYHMLEVMGDPPRAQAWQDAIDGKPVDWARVMDGYNAAVDWPAAAFWSELADANPDAVVLLSTRSSADAWWKSASATIFEVMGQTAPSELPHYPALVMAQTMVTKKFTPDWQDPEAAKAAYDAHNANVRASVPAARLVDWQPGDGWDPICAALNVAIPDEPFPHVNSTADFRAMIGLDG
jgi:Sulfotransferase domain